MIASPHNAKLKHARGLLAQRKLRERHRQFVIEGLHLWQEAERAGIEPALLFLSEAFLRSPEGQAIAARRGAAAELVADKALASLSDTVTPQGIVAVLPIPSPVARKRDLLLVLDGVRDPGNVGTLLRTALAAGADEVLLAPGCADPFSPKVVRAALGAHFRLPIRDLDWEALGKALAGTRVALADAAGDTDYDAWDWRGPSALIVGGEAQGAGSAARALAERRVRIPMAAASESLNAAVAGGVILFEAARQRRAAFSPAGGTAV